MKPKNNSGFDPIKISEYRSKIGRSGHSFLLVDTDSENDEFAHFYFIGIYENEEVIYDATICTLRLLHESELFDIAEHRAAQHFPDYKKITYKEDENGNLKALDDLEEEIGLFMAEVIVELEEEGEIKISEQMDIDLNIDFGVGLDVSLHVEKVTPKVIDKFIREFNEGKLKLDNTHYSFQTYQEITHSR